MEITTHYLGAQSVMLNLGWRIEIKTERTLLSIMQCGEVRILIGTNVENWDDF